MPARKSAPTRSSIPPIKSASHEYPATQTSHPTRTATDRAHDRRGLPATHLLYGQRVAGSSRGRPQLPTARFPDPAPTHDIPDEPIIVIAPDGQVSVNDYPYDTPDAAALPELIHMLKRYHHSCQGNRVTASVTLAPAAAVRQQRIVEVMDACTQASISGLSFASDRE